MLERAPSGPILAESGSERIRSFGQLYSHLLSIRADDGKSERIYCDYQQHFDPRGPLFKKKGSGSILDPPKVAYSLRRFEPDR